MSRGAGGLSYEHYERTSIVWDMDQLPLAGPLGGARCSTEGAIRGKSVRRRVHSDP